MCRSFSTFFFRTIDQFANLVLHETLERIHVDNCYGDIQRGIFLIRGENVVLAGEIDEEKEKSTGISIFFSTYSGRSASPYMGSFSLETQMILLFLVESFSKSLLLFFVFKQIRRV